ncbi:MAG TPA: protein kinase [Streptosporangiaceae bacterium]|nr:protein kinase [Streptosporangiaceae bacterium]
MTDQPPGMSGRLRAGSQIAGYRLEEQIGMGGMATVFRAYDRRLDRQVALKVLAPALAEDEAFRRRFVRESRAAAAVDDPHIIPVFEAGEADGMLFIAMRLVRGGDVRSLVDRLGPLPAARAAEIITQAASALDAAHARGLVHRDVKPANMLLDASQAADRPDHVYLSDFGLSKTSLSVSGLTSTGQFLGTLDYVAPEQIEGRRVDGRTDQYGLACAAFELLCGDPPFRREDSVSVMYAQLNEPPPRLSARRADLAGAIDEVMARALAKSPDDRYRSCGEFAAALRLALGPAVAGRDRPAGHPATEIASPLRASGEATIAPEPVADSSPERPLAGAGHTQAVQQPAAGMTSPLSAPRADRTEPGSVLPGPAADTVPGAAGADEMAPQARRPWWRSPLPVAGICAVVLLAGGGSFALASRGHGSGGHHAAPPSSLPAVSLPGCTTATASAPTSASVTSAAVATGGSPFGVAVTADGQYSFVTTGNAVDVFRDSGGLAPALLSTISASHAGREDTITPDGQFLLAAAGSGAVVINVADAEQGSGNAIAGWLTSPSGSGAFQVLVSANSQYAFVTLQNSAEMAVFNLRAALTQGFSAADFIGYVPLGNQPLGLASDGTWLYAASLGGTISVVSLAKAEADPASAVVATAPAGCGSDRTMLSADGSVLWVTARQSDALLAFSTVRLRSDPLHALVAKVMVGEVPLGETFIDGGTKIVLADSNLNGLKTAVANLAVVDTASALAGKPALLGYVPTGLVPRSVVAEPGGATLLVTDYDSGQIEALRIADLP